MSTIKCIVFVFGSVNDASSTNVHRFALNIKSVDPSAIHVEAFDDLKNSPIYGWDNILLEEDGVGTYVNGAVLISSSPIVPAYTVYFVLSECKTTACSPGSKYTGGLKTNLVYYKYLILVT